MFGGQFSNITTTKTMLDHIKQPTCYVAKYSPEGRQYEIKDHKYMTEASPKQLTNLSRRHWPMKQLENDCSRLIPWGRGLSSVHSAAAFPIHRNQVTPRPQQY